MKKHRKLLTLGVVICLVAGLVAGIVYYKQVEEERKLSLIYIPKVVDGTNDFWTSLIQGRRWLQRNIMQISAYGHLRKRMMWMGRTS